MKLKRFNESVRDSMKPKSKEDMKKVVDKLPNDRKLYYVEKYDLVDLYTQKEIDEFEANAPIVKELGRWFRVEKGDNHEDHYDVLIQGEELGSIIVLETDGMKRIGDRDLMQLAPYDDWEEFEEIIENHI